MYTRCVGWSIRGLAIEEQGQREAKRARLARHAGAGFRQQALRAGARDGGAGRR